MLVKALTNFAGKLSMCANEIREVEEDDVIRDLLNTGYIEEIKEAEIKEKKVQPKKAHKKK